MFRDPIIDPTVGGPALGATPEDLQDRRLEDEAGNILTTESGDDLEWEGNA